MRIYPFEAVTKMSGHVHDIDCQRAYDLLFDYLEGSLPTPVTQDVDAHFAVCPPCQQFMSSYKKTPELTRAALEQEVPEAVAHGLMEFLRAKLPSK
jgi:anti-sigma factor RsiW